MLQQWLWLFFLSGTSKFQQSDNSSKTSHAIFRRSADVDFARVRTIESMVVVEKVMTKFYGVEAIRTYVPTLVNIVRENNLGVKNILW